MKDPYIKAKNEIPKRATYFVSFWWAIFWKEALALAITSLVWQFTSQLSPSLWFKLPLALVFIVVLYYFFRELFYATLEKRYLRKNFTMVGVDKDGNFSEQKLDQAKILLWSFLWAHLYLVLLATLLTILLISGWWLFVDGLDFAGLFIGIMLALIEPNALLVWVIIFSIYPHYWIWQRQFYNLAGFRLALTR